MKNGFLNETTHCTVAAECLMNASHALMVGRYYVLFTVLYLNAIFNDLYLIDASFIGQLQHCFLLMKLDLTKIE